MFGESRSPFHAYTGFKPLKNVQQAKEHNNQLTSKSEKRAKKVLTSLFQTSYPDKKPYLIRNLVNSSYDLMSNFLDEDVQTWRGSDLSPIEQDKFISDSICISRRHLDFSKFAFQNDHYAEAIYYAYLSLEIGSKTLNAMIDSSSIFDQKYHDQSKRQHKFLRDKHNIRFLSNLQPVLGTGVILQSKQEIKRSINKLDSYYDKNAKGFGLEIDKDGLEHICHALIEFCHSTDSSELTDIALKSMTIKANKNPIFRDLRREHFEQIVSCFMSLSRVIVLRPMLLFLLEPHKNVTRYIQGEFSPLDYVDDKITATEAIPLISNLEKIFVLLDVLITDVEILAPDSQLQWLNIVSNSCESVYKTWKKERRRSRNRIARGIAKIRD